MGGPVARRQHFYLGVESGYRRGFRRFTLSDNRVSVLGTLKPLNARRNKGSEHFGKPVDLGDFGPKAVNFLKKARNPHKLKVLAIHFGKVPLRMSQ
jgi:hypothetical protein